MSLFNVNSSDILRLEKDLSIHTARKRVRDIRNELDINPKTRVTWKHLCVYYDMTLIEFISFYSQPKEFEGFLHRFGLLSNLHPNGSKHAIVYKNVQTDFALAV